MGANPKLSFSSIGDPKSSASPIKMHIRSTRNINSQTENIWAATWPFGCRGVRPKILIFRRERLQNRIKGARSADGTMVEFELRVVFQMVHASPLLAQVSISPKGIWEMLARALKCHG